MAFLRSAFAVKDVCKICALRSVFNVKSKTCKGGTLLILSWGLIQKTSACDCMSCMCMRKRCAVQVLCSIMTMCSASVVQYHDHVNVHQVAHVQALCSIMTMRSASVAQYHAGWTRP